MATYRKKPIIVEAEQWFPDRDVPGVQHDPTHGPFVETMHNGQIVYLELGDYILPEPDGKHFYPVKASVFEATYEVVEDGSPCLPDKHEWKSQRLGGPPDMAESLEMVRYCKKCGKEYEDGD